VRPAKYISIYSLARTRFSASLSIPKNISFFHIFAMSPAVCHPSPRVASTTILHFPDIGT
jgi:hypothetical protein